MKPPTFHKLGVLVDGLKIHGVAIVAFVPGEMLEKSPESWETKELIQVATLVAEERETLTLPILSPKLTVPMKSIWPTIGLAA